MRNTLLPGPQPQEQPFPTVTPPVEVLSGCYTCFDFFFASGTLKLWGCACHTQQMLLPGVFSCLVFKSRCCCKPIRSGFLMLFSWSQEFSWCFCLNCSAYLLQCICVAMCCNAHLHMGTDCTDDATGIRNCLVLHCERVTCDSGDAGFVTLNIQVSYITPSKLFTLNQ